MGMNMDSSCWTNWKSDEEIHRILQQRKDNGENKRAASIGLQTAALCSTRILEASPTFGSRFNFVRPAFLPSAFSSGNISCDSMS